MSIAAALVLAAMTSADAIVVMLNSPGSVSAGRYAEAKALVERDAKAGAPVQQFLVAVNTDDKNLREKYLKASKGKITAMAEKRDNALAWYLLSLENNDLKLLYRAARLGNVQALNAMGTIAIQEVMTAKNLNSNAVEKVMSKSFDCFRKAAAEHDPNGYINLGACYLRGIGCRQDPVMAFSSFLSAAKAGHPEGMDYVSAAYQNGHGVEKDERLSLWWRMKAKSLRGDKDAAKWLKEKK